MTAPGLSRLVSTTLRNRENDFSDNLTQSNAVLTKLEERGNIKRKSGGRDITIPIKYDGNNSYSRISGFDTFDNTPYETLTAANYDWKFAVTNVSLAKTELMKNQGTEAVLDIMESEIESAIDTLANNVNADMYSDGTADGSKQITGLQALIADDPTTDTTVGGINQQTYDWWRNYEYDFSTDVTTAATSSNITGAMNNVYDNVSRGRETTDLIISAQNYYSLYRESLTADQRFTAGGEMAQRGFVSLKFLTADVVLENSADSIPVDHMYFLNTKYLYLCVHENGMMQVDEERLSSNQLAMNVPIVFMGNLTTSNRARQGVLKA